MILLYYLVATLFPIDKIIGKIYPIFGAILLLSAIGVFAGIFIQGYQLDNIDFSHGLKGIFDVYPIFDAQGNSGVGTKFIPVFFVTVACGITSGFHSTQCTLIGRTITPRIAMIPPTGPSRPFATSPTAAVAPAVEPLL